MGYTWARWLPTELRAAGLTVVEVEGWENRGRPASVGSFEPNGAHTKHHTGTPTSPARPIPTLRLLILGRPDLPGPLCQVATAYNGVVYVIAAGRANHAGPIGRPGVAGMRYGGDGNRYAIGDEVDTDGTQTLPDAQRRSLAIVARVINDHYDRSEDWTHRHADISSSGKWDIGQLTTTQLRAMVRDANTQEDPMAQYEAQLNTIAGDAKAARSAAEQTLAEQRSIRQGTTKSRNEQRRRLKALAASTRERATKQQAEDILKLVGADEEDES